MSPILTAEATDALIKQGKVARRVDIARSSIGLGVRSGTPKPDVSSAEAVKRTLLGVEKSLPATRAPRAASTCSPCSIGSALRRK